MIIYILKSILNFGVVDNFITDLDIICILKLILIFVVGLFVYILLYDHCVYGKKFLLSLKERTIQFFLSPILFSIFKVVVIVAIFYLIYALMHNASPFKSKLTLCINRLLSLTDLRKSPFSK